MSKFYNPKIGKVFVIVEGEPNQLYTQGMRSFEQYDEICKYLGPEKMDLNAIHKENNVIETQEELANVKKKLKLGKHTCLIMRMEHPRAYEIC